MHSRVSHGKRRAFFLHLQARLVHPVLFFSCHLTIFGLSLVVPRRPSHNNPRKAFRRHSWVRLLGTVGTQAISPSAMARCTRRVRMPLSTQGTSACQQRQGQLHQDVGVRFARRDGETAEEQGRPPRSSPRHSILRKHNTCEYGGRCR